MNRILKRIAAVFTAVSVIAAIPCFAYGATYTSDITVIGQQLRSACAQRLKQDTLLFKTQEKLRVSTLNSELYRVTDDPYEGDYLRYTIDNIEYKVADLKKSGTYYYYLLRAVPVYKTDIDQQQAVIQYVDEKTSGFGFTFMDSEYYKVRTIYDYLKSDIVYDESAGDTAYDAASGTADSKGIAMLAYAVFKNAGIGTRIIAGSAGHYWNLVKIGEEWYNLDITSEEEGGFLTSDETFGNLYERDIDQTQLESCPADYAPSEEVFDLGITNDPSTGKLIIAWNRIEGATYKVYRNTSPGVTDTEADEPFLETDSSTFTDSEGTAGKKYYYIITAEKEGVTYKTVERYRCVDLAAPTAKSALLSSKIKVTWTKVSGAKKYYVYRSTSPDRNFKLVKTTTGRVYYHTTAKKGVRYYYKIKASNGNSAATSVFSNMAYRTFR